MTRGNSARLLLAACLATQSNASVNSLTKERVATVAAAGVQQLMSFFDWKLGWFGNASQGTPFWETANAVETLVSALQGGRTATSFEVEIEFPLPKNLGRIGSVFHSNNHRHSR